MWPTQNNLLFGEPNICKVMGFLFFNTKYYYVPKTDLKLAV